MIHGVLEMVVIFHGELLVITKDIKGYIYRIRIVNHDLGPITNG